MNFKKIASIAASVLMAGMSMGLASAAAFPAPFVQNGSANAAIVWGTGQGVSQTDYTAASNIAASLANSVTPTGTTNISGENVLLQMPNSYLHVGDNLTSVFDRPITKTDMPTLLADGTYKDSKNNDHDYTQKINMASLTLNQFNLENFDSNVSTSTPAVGFNLSSSNEVLSYVLNFQSQINMSRMKYTNLNLMGKTYYVLDTSTNSLTLLDSASTTSLSSGQSATLASGGKTYSVTATYVDSSQVRLTVNGQETDMLNKGDAYKLSDGSYVGIKDVYSNGAPSGSYEAGVTFSIGSGKIVLTSGSDVEVNSDSVSGVTATLGTTTSSSTTYLNNLTIQWNPSDTVALTKDSTLTMPAFDGVKLSFAGMTYPSTETTKVSNDGNTAVKLSTTVQDGSVNLDILGMDKTSGNFTSIGKDSTANNKLVTNGSNVLNNVSQYNEFVVSQNGGKVAESHVYKVTSFSNATSSHDTQVVLTPQDGGSQLTLTEGQSTPIGEVTGLTLKPSIDYASKTVNFTANTDGNFATLYTKDGLTISLPTPSVVNSTAYGNATGVSSYSLLFKEADKNGNIASTSLPSNFTLTLGSAGSADNYKTSVNDVSLTNGVEVGDTNVYQYMISSPLATMVSHDTSPTQETATITYHGGESYGKLYLASPSATVSNGAGSLGNIIYKDSEVSSITADNVIIVGGSCINSAAATVLGVSAHTCGDAFTQATGVGAGQYLIEGFNNPGLGNAKYALVVAGYGPTDTMNAATYLKMKNPDLASKWVGTSATEATVVTTQ